jgi:ABC-type multidrug transport system fused ATPase/permease subunit
MWNRASIRASESLDPGVGPAKRFGLRAAIELLSRRQRSSLVLLTAARIAVGFFDLVLAAAMYLLFLLLQGHAPLHRYSWMPKTVLAASIAAAALVLLRAITDFASARAVFSQIQNLATDLMLRLTYGYCEMRWARYVELNRAELLHTVAHTTREAAEFYYRCVEMIASVVIVLAMTAALIYQSPAAALALVLALGAFYCTHRFVIRKRVQIAAAMREGSFAAIQQDLSGLFASGKEIRTYQNHDFFHGRIRREAEKLKAGNMGTVFLPVVARTVADQGTILLFLGFIVTIQLLRGDTQQLLSLLVFYFVLSRRLLPLLSQLSLIAGQMEGSLENVRIVDAELARCSAHRADTLPSAQPGPGIALQLEHVSFSFGNCAPILRNLNFLLHEGEIAIVHGVSGIGKTSLLNLISGVLQPTFGRARVHSRSVSYVPQEIVLLNDTIRNNLLFGLIEIRDERLNEVLAVARLDEFVAALPRGLDTPVGENGALLSGGERQRLGLARAILRGSRLMLLDEATSAIDEENERRVLSNLAAAGVAIVLVTHRRHVEQWADSVYRLEDGQLVEEHWKGLRIADDCASPLFEAAQA